MTLSQIKDILKKFWFVILVGCIFIGFAVYFAWDTNKDKLSGKTVDGKDVIFSSDDTNYTADEYYEKLFKTASGDTTLGIQQLYNLLEYEVLDRVDANEDLEKQAEETTEQLVATLKESYGSSYETLIGAQLTQLGYEGGAEDFEEFQLNMLKRNKLMAQYIKNHPELFDAIYEKEKPREISHILVMVSDDASEEAKAKAEEKKEKITKELKEGKSFAKVAKKYSDDEASKVDGGSLGMQLNSANLVEAFKKAAWELKEGETSEWVKTEYGYHLIKVDCADKKKLLKNKNNEAAIVSAVMAKNTNLSTLVIWEKAKEMDLEIKDKDIKAALMAFIGVEK